MLLLVCNYSFAYDFKEGGIYYSFYYMDNGRTLFVSRDIDYPYSGSITIPAYVIHEGYKYPVTAIDQEAFYECENLVSVTIPNSVTSIGLAAFASCTRLKSVTLSNSLKIIGRYAFSDCKSLRTITIPNSVTTIEDYAFQGCSNLTTASVPKTVKTIGIDVFNKCPKLNSTSSSKIKTAYFNRIKYRIVDDSAKTCAVTPEKFEERNGTRNLYTSSYQGYTIIPEKVKLFNDEYTVVAIDEQAFRESAVTQIELPNTIKTIGLGAFHNASQLSSIEIPASVTSIGQYAFERTRLKELTIPATVTSVGGGFVSYCSDLRALYWNSSIEVPYSYDVENCFLYFPSGDYSYNRSYWTNVIFDGVAESIVLNESGDRPTQSYGCLKAFTAKKVTYYRNFEQTTYPGKSSGWQTIVLPFKPTSITHESKGAVAPFNSNVEGAKPFWLRALTSEGWKDVTTIEPNKGYIIAMPNHSDYMEGYRLNGKICFSAENVQIGVTPETLDATVGPEYEFQPIYHTEAKAAGVYALNVDYTESGVEYYGSAFIRSSSDVRPYEAYVKTLGGNRSARSVFSVDTRSSASRASWQRNTTGIPQIGDM